MTNAAAFAVFGLLLAVPGRLVALGLVPAMALFTLAEMLSMPPSGELGTSLAPEHIRGRYLGVFQLSWTVGNTIAPALLTMLLSRGPLWPWVVVGALNLLALPLVLSLGDRTPRDGARQEPAPPAQEGLTS
ncbi:hypothetical protein GCM10010302_25550 [Streptomyces polychromogenes]|uniref:Major facilitator superfamily (MFS) profile domain-containing protein n=1 Tax=Streptomyces polychromogenes TaxID=67342 RepID=A0ABN0VBY6_9ACTN